MIMTGSRAFLQKIALVPNLLNRMFESDYDVIMTYKEFQEWKEKYGEYITLIEPVYKDKFKVLVFYGREMQYEIEIGMANNSSKLLLDNKDRVSGGTVLGFFGEEYTCLNLEYCLLTKRSHLMHPIQIEKHTQDYRLIKYAVGDFEEDELMKQYYKLRLNEAKKRNEES